MAKYIYLDNNATTKTCDEAAQVMREWIQSCSNPSGSSFLSGASKIMIKQAKTWISKLCKLRDDYHILFTSGATESNCTILNMVVNAWKHNTDTTPHIITSAVEHKSILECLEQMNDDNRMELTIIEPNMYGQIDPDDVAAAIQDNTALITIMFANNELGSINPIKKIAEVSHAKNIPFHTDAVQIFGKIALDVPKFGIDALSMSFHKLYGPPGIGLLILRKTFVTGYDLRGVITGTQQEGLRGGTENIPGIAGSAAALIHNFKSRKTKNNNLSKMRSTVIQRLSKKIPVVDYSELYEQDDPDITDRRLVVLGSPDKNGQLPSTLLMSILDGKKKFCNIKLKKLLEDNGIIISIGSACNTASDKASHVLNAIKAPAVVKRGVFRVSFGDNNTIDDCRKFCDIFLRCLALV